MKKNILFFMVILLFFNGCGENTPNNDADAGGEECNGADDDGDGYIDESDTGGPLRRDCSNFCGTGTEECVGGVWMFCSVTPPSQEICDRFDNDCDGVIDEDCDCTHGERQECGEAIGACESGVQFCDRGEWGDCQLPYDPETLEEICNDGIDNDCDGEQDEDCSCTPGDTQACGIGEGECQQGEQTCGDESTWDPECIGEVGPVDEMCNGLDDDCDGEEDSIAWLGFSWSNDRLEVNNLCNDATPLYNESGAAELVESTEWQPMYLGEGADPTDILSYPTLYPTGDEDWYSFRAVEASHSCFPFTAQCAFGLTVRLGLLDARLGYGAQDPDDYELCIVVGDCASGTTPGSENIFCTHGTDYRADNYAFYKTIVWGGTCATEDNRDIWIKVSSPTGRACGHYSLQFLYYLNPDYECP